MAVRLRRRWRARALEPAGTDARSRPEAALSQDLAARRGGAIEAAVGRFCFSTRTPASAASEIVLDLDATDDPLHGIRRAGSFTAITTAIATCRFISSAAGIFWPPSCGPRTSTAAPGRKKRWRALSSKSARAGRG